jgi:hypothetical protein
MAIAGVYTPNVVPLYAVSGDTFSTRIEFTYGTFGSYHLDVSCSQFELQVLDDTGSSVFSFTEGKGLEWLSNSIIRLYKPAAQMQLKGSFTYDLKQTLADGTVNTLLRGDFIIE